MKNIYAGAMRVITGRYLNDFAWRESQEEFENEADETDHESETQDEE